ncbi:non-ribosomal peptide synthetase [Photorhabdus sp. CRCIA-P01]|uniref:non-ribosomal peptide synthetase n=1 Tax=Photorhabdus sp. CRCIA-P01 TaxID=2019570 RepID=UPI000E5991D1|nr:non-ribosomal peptide synthetase [Photorhabdus sp. CRCIA-P01]
MELLNIGYIGDNASGKIITEEIRELGHEVILLTSINKLEKKLNLIITTENHASVIQALEKKTENLLFITSNKEIVKDLDTLQAQERLSLYFTSPSKSGYLCGYISREDHGAEDNYLEHLSNKITDIVVGLSRGEHPTIQDTPHHLDRKFYAEEPDCIRSLITLLLQRLGDQMQGMCASDLSHMTWYPNADFHTVLATVATSDNGYLTHFFFNETGALKHNKYAKSRVMIRVVENGDGTQVSICGDDMRFSRFTDYLDALVSATIDPTRAPFITQPDELYQLRRFNETGDPSLLSHDITTLFHHHAEIHPELIALHADNRDYSYGELNQASDQMACWLLKQNGNNGSLIAVAMQKSALLLIVLLGILKSNKTYILLDPQAPETRNQSILDDVQPTLILADSPLKAGNAPCILSSTINYQTLHVSARDLPSANKESLAYVCYTSGTTGKPKGVMVTREGLSNVAQNHRDFIQLGIGSRVLAIASLGFDAFGWDIYGALVSGATLYLAPAELHTDVGALHHYLAQHEVGHVTITPAILELLPRDVWQGLQSIIVMGDAPPSDVVAWWSDHTRLCNGYGPTEATIATSLCEYRPGVAWNCIGAPLKNYRCHILDAYHNPMPVGFEGELCIAGNGLARGYLHQPMLSAEKFVTMCLPYMPNEERFYKTGDIAKWDEQGNIIFIGRRDHQVKIRGVRIEIGEVESALRSHPQVESVCVVARTQSADKILVAFVQPTSPELTSDTLRHAMVPLLHPAAIPASFVFLSSLPLTINGKVARQQLESWPLDDQTHRITQPETETEAILERIVANAIGCSHTDVNHEFINLGAHSLTMSKIVALIARDLCCRLNIADLFQHNTIRKLAEYIENKAVVADRTITIAEERRTSLSPQQNLLWYLSALNPDDCSYNLPLAIEILGQLDLTNFERAVNSIYEKHESLRTQFTEVNGLAYQYAQPHIPINLADHSVDGQQMPLEKLVKLLCETPFDITQRPPVTLRLLHYHDQHHVLVWVKHNILTDAWSEQLILNDLWQHYNDLCLGVQPAPLLSQIQTIDIVNNSVNFCTQNEITYWQQRLEGCRELDFPLDKPRPLMPTHAGDRIRHSLQADIAMLLEQQAKTLGATPFVLLTAALTYLLGKYTQQQDIMIGTAISARDNLSLAQVSGFHVNTVPLRTILCPQDTIANLIDKMMETCIGAYQHQQLSFDRILHQIEYERVSNKNPLFQIMAILQNAGDVCQTGLHGCTLQRLPVASGFSMFDMTWNFNLTEGAIVIELDYASELFYPATMQMMLDNYEQVLDQLLTLPSSAPLSTVNPLCASEQNWLLQLACNPVTNRRGSLIEQIHRMAQTQPYNIAVSCEQQQYNYGQLWDISERIAHALQSIDNQTFSVGIMMEKSCRVAALILGVLKAGKHYVPIDVNYPADRVSYMVENAQTRILVTDDNSDCALNHIATLSFETLVATRLVTDRPLPMLSDEMLAYIMYTSGSTGNPKGVMITQGNLNNFTNDFVERLALASQDKVLSLTSISFDIFGLELFCSLVSGAHVVLCPRETAMDPVRLYHFIEQQQPRVIQATPTVWSTIVNHLSPATERPLTVLCGGEKMPAVLLAQLRRIATQILQVYGPTETTIWSTCADLTHHGDSACIGMPINMTDAFVMDEAGNLMPSGAFGELYLGGAGVSPGYWNNQTLTDKVFLQRKVLGSRRYLYRTGDIVRFTRQGQLEYLGRNDHQVKIRGHRIELTEIDLCLSAIGIIERAMSLIVGEGQHARIVSYLQLVPGVTLNEKMVRTTLKAKLPNIMIPSGFVVLETFPLTNNNKIDIRKLPAPEMNYSASEVDYIPPANEAEHKMQQVWQQVLALAQVSVTDSFFTLGGNSLQIPQLLHAIRLELGITLTIREFILHSQIRELTVLVQSKSGETAHGTH